MSQQAIPAMTASGQPVLILREGTSQSRGREAQKNNITAAKLVAEVLKTSLGPRGMDKMLVDSLGDVTITNDGATILKEIDIQHPAAKMMVEISKTTDNEVGDGTTSAVILAGSLLENAEKLIVKDVHPTIIVDGYRKASNEALKAIKKVAIKVSPTDKVWLTKVAKTALSTKLVAKHADVLSEMVVDACLQVAEKPIGSNNYSLDIDDIKVEKKPGGSLTDTSVRHGIVIDKEIVHGAMPTKITNAKIALIASPLEIEKTEFDAKLNISDPAQIKAFLDQENQMLKTMSDKIKKAGANVVLAQKGIDDVIQHYLAKEKITAVRRIRQSDADKIAKATGAKIITNVNELRSSDLGSAGLVEQREIENDKWVFVEKCAKAKSVSLLIRGGTQRIVDEAARSVNDALMVVKDVMEYPFVVAGGGAPEALISHHLRTWSNKLSGRIQLAVQQYSDAIEKISLALAENAGLDHIDAQVELRAKHGKGNNWIGININSGKVDDMQKVGVFEPLAVKEQIITSSTEATSMILRIDDVIAGVKANPGPQAGGGMGPGGMPGGMPPGGMPPGMDM